METGPTTITSNLLKFSSFKPPKGPLHSYSVLRSVVFSENNNEMFLPTMNKGYNSGGSHVDCVIVKPFQQIVGVCNAYVYCPSLYGNLIYFQHILEYTHANCAPFSL